VTVCEHWVERTSKNRSPFAGFALGIWVSAFALSDEEILSSRREQSTIEIVSLSVYRRPTVKSAKSLSVLSVVGPQRSNYNAQLLNHGATLPVAPLGLAAIPLRHMALSDKSHEYYAATLKELAELEAAVDRAAAFNS
jgi:hypothetical protein